MVTIVNKVYKATKSRGHPDCHFNKIWSCMTFSGFCILQLQCIFCTEYLIKTAAWEAVENTSTWRHQHHLRQKQPPTLLLSEQKGWVNNISQHFFLKLYYTRSHCHALGWLSLNIHVMHTWATLSFAMICHSGAFAKLWKKLWFSSAFATAYRNATHTHRNFRSLELKRCNKTWSVKLYPMRLYGSSIQGFPPSLKILERRDGHLEKNVNCVEEPSCITSTTSTSMIRNNLWI